RTGRKTVATLLLLIVLGIAVVMTPLVAVPLAIAGTGVTGAVTDAGGSAGGTGTPAVSGDWGYPVVGEYTTSRGFGYHPVKNCAYCPAQHLGYDMDNTCGATI